MKLAVQNLHFSDNWYLYRNAHLFILEFDESGNFVLYSTMLGVKGNSLLSRIYDIQAFVNFH